MNLMLCLTGVGTQFLAIVSGILLMALLGMFNVHRHGSINAAAILLYAFTSCEFSWILKFSLQTPPQHHYCICLQNFTITVLFKRDW